MRSVTQKVFSPISLLEQPPEESKAAASEAETLPTSPEIVVTGAPEETQETEPTEELSEEKEEVTTDDKAEASEEAEAEGKVEMTEEERLEEGGQRGLLIITLSDEISLQTPELPCKRGSRVALTGWALTNLIKSSRDLRA